MTTTAMRPAQPDGHIRQLRAHRRSTPKASISSLSSDWSTRNSDWELHAQQRSESGSISPSLSSPARSEPPPSPSPLLLMPPELLIHHILPHLNYPSLLALRLAHPYFYHSPLLYPARAPATRLRVAWLYERNVDMSLFITGKSGHVDMSSDRGFLANVQVQTLLRREHRHDMCVRGPAGCRVVLGVTCGGPRLAGGGGLMVLKWTGISPSWVGDQGWVSSILGAFVAIGAAVLALFASRGPQLGKWWIGR